MATLAIDFDDEEEEQNNSANKKPTTNSHELHKPVCVAKMFTISVENKAFC